MKLRKVRVTNYRSVSDSGEFSVGDLTCLVGKNESGKTTVLQALAGLRPIGADPKLSYDKQRDYPRRHLNQYTQRHPDADARVVETTWELAARDVEAVEEDLGPGCLTGSTVTVARGYGTAAETMWTVPIDEAKVVAFLIKGGGLSKQEKAALRSPSTVQHLRAALAARETTSPAMQALINRIEGFRKSSPTLAAIDILSKRLPSFLYFSNYNRMVGSISLDRITQDKAQHSVSSEQSVYLHFLDFAGMTPEALAQTSRYEEQKTLVEAASINITDQIFEYWSQNRHLSVQFEVADGGLDRRWTPCPANGVDKVNAFLSLFGGNKLHCAVLLDLAAGQKGKVQKLRELENSILRKGHVFTVADFVGTTEADIEDLFHPHLYALMLNGTFGLEGEKALAGDGLRAAEGTRLVQKAERLVNGLLPPGQAAMSHYAPALWLIQHPEVLTGAGPEVEETLANFQKVFEAFNLLL